MAPRTASILTSTAGILGTIALTLYFTAPFHWMPLPPPEASAEQIMTFGKLFHSEVMLDTWLQQAGTILSVIFALALVHLGGGSGTLAGKLTLLASTVITCLSLAEGSFAIGAVQAGNHGHSEAALTCFELTNTFIHIFLLAPSLFLMMGLALIQSTILPKAFIYSAIFLGIGFQILGVLALFFEKALFLVIIILMLQNLWTISTSMILIFSKQVSTDRLQG
jgi:hypothetical protein